MKYYLLEENLLEEQKRKNRQLEESYAYILEFINKLSSSFEHPALRTRIEVNHKLNPDTVATIHECVTPYCIVSLGADETGYFNIAYSIGSHAQEFIGEYGLGALIRAINRYTMTEFTKEIIEHRVRLHSLNFDVATVFNDLLNQGDNEFRTIIMEELESGE